MTSQSKILKQDETPSVERMEEVRATTPVPMDDEETVPRDEQGELYPEYNGGLTPQGSPQKSVDPPTDSAKDSDDVETSEEPTEDPEQEEKDEDKIKEGSRSGSPVPERQQEVVFTHSSGPLTPQMLAPQANEKRSRKRRDEDPHRSDRGQSTPSRQPDSHDLIALHREMSLIMSNNLKENDIRQLTLSMQGQISQMTGTINSYEGSLAKLLRQSQSTHGHAVLQEEAFKSGIAKVELDVRSAWISQARNRAAIAENGTAIKELAKEISTCHGLLKEIVTRIPPTINPFGPPAEPNWMYPNQTSPGPLQQGQTLQSIIPALQQLIGQRNQEPTKKPKQPNPKKELTCAYCMAPHRSYECDVLLTWQERRRFILNNLGCMKCLHTNVDKTTHTCEREKILCTQCQKEFHHRSICERAPAQESHEQGPPAKKPKHFHKKDSSKFKPKATKAQEK